MPDSSRYSKRHASFNSPREVPLPSPTADNLNSFLFSTTAQDAFESHSSSVLPSPSAVLQDNGLPSSPPLMNMPNSPPSHSDSHFPFPDTQSTSPPRQSPSPPPDLAHMSTTWLDRNSSASLPLPSQIPFHALPRVNNPSMLSSSPALNLATDLRAPRPSSPPSSSTEGVSPHLTDRSAFRCPSVDEAASSSSSSSSGSGGFATTSTSSIDIDPSSDKFSSVPSATTGPTSNTRPISPFRAPQPPPPQPARSPATGLTTAMGRFMVPHTLPAYQPPDPPVILPAEPGDDMTQSVSRPYAPHFPFLSHAPPPPDSWIQVETTLSEYKLLVHLPGFSREGITLATKRRRILHVVADRWDNGGGHFERRISFGYDADLVQVRAEFDGTMLRIVVPRRISPVTLGPIGRI